MKSRNISDAFFLSNPMYRGMAEEIIIVCTGSAGLLLGWSRFRVFPWTNMIGILLLIFSFAFHRKAEKNHEQAHRASREIRMLITDQVYSKIRHPLYLSLIGINLGIALAFGILIPHLLVLISIVHWVVTSLKEEEFLMHEFPEQYSRYKKTVRWRMVPGIF
jgi:protein-S-isoprenylcysteine O-methyltransferase Ste14